MNVIKRFNFIRIEPEEIIFLSIHPAEGTTKDVWKKTKQCFQKHIAH
jgi:hypothetical protein